MLDRVPDQHLSTLPEWRRGARFIMQKIDPVSREELKGSKAEKYLASEWIGYSSGVVGQPLYYYPDTNVDMQKTLPNHTSAVHCIIFLSERSYIIETKNSAYRIVFDEHQPPPPPPQKEEIIPEIRETRSKLYDWVDKIFPLRRRA